MGKIFLFVSLIMLATTSIAHAEDASATIDAFYNGIAEIIERNMNAPDNCVKEIDAYYKANQETVEKIRKMAEKPMAEAMAMMKKYESMSEEELEALEKEAEQKVKQYEGEEIAPGATRYSEALAAFTQKYPHHALQIAAKAMQLIPMASFDK